MSDESLTNITAMKYHWGTMINGQWQKKGTLTITNKGVLLDNEKLVNPRYNSTYRSLIFGGDHGTYARTGKLTLDVSQRYFHGVMEQDDGSSEHITGFADFSATYSTIIKPVNNPNAPGAKGPILKISIQNKAFDGPVDSNPINFTLISNGITTNITDRVTSHDLNPVNHTFEITMGPGGPFPPTKNLFDITMLTDMSEFSGTFDFGPEPTEKYTWIGRVDQQAIKVLNNVITDAEIKLESAKSPKIRNIAAAERLAKISNLELDALNSNAVDGDDQAAILPGLDAQDLAFIVKMEAKGIKIATLDNISAVTIKTDKDGKSKVIDKAQEISATVMNTATLQSLAEPWATDFNLKPEPLDDKAEAIRLANPTFFNKNADLQMANLLKYKQDVFKGVDLAAVKSISKAKLKKAWSFKTMKPERLNGFMKASSEMYGYAYAQVREEFAAYTESEKEQWGRAYFHWLTDPSQIRSWQKQLNQLTPDQLTVWIYEWHAKLSILAPHKHYAAAMQAYALVSFMNEKSLIANWSELGIPFLTEAIASGGQANVNMKTADNLSANSPKAPFIKQKLAELNQNVGADIVANAISKAALKWQEINVGSSYYGYLYTTPSAIDEIEQELNEVTGSAFKSWADTAPPVINSNTQSSAGEILSYCVYASINGVLLAGLAPKSPKSSKTSFTTFNHIHLPPDVAWVLKGIKIGQVVVNGAAAIFGIYFIKRMSTLFTSGLGSEGANESAGILGSISNGIEEGEEVAGWVASFGAGLSAVLKVVGPILAIVGVGLSAFNLVKDIKNDRVGDGVLDAIGLLAGAIGAFTGVAVAFGLMTAAAAGPIGLVVAGIGLIVLVFKFLWDWIFPEPTPLQKYVADPLTKLGLITT